MTSVLLVLSVLAANPPNEAARRHYDSAQFEKCLQVLRRGGPSDEPAALRAERELLIGLCQASLSLPDANDHLRIALELDRDVALPPHVSPKIIRQFEQLRGQMKAPPAPERPADVPLAAAPERTVVPAPRTEERLSPPPPRRRSTVVPVAFAGGAVAAAAVGVGFGLQARSVQEEADSAPFESDAKALGREAQSAATRANLSYGLAAGAALVAVVTYLLQPPL